jgi:putative transposase
MSQSLSKIYIHTIFSTKGRNPWINEAIAPHLHAYMASILKKLNNPAVIVNSMPDHIHILFRLSKSMSISQVMEQVKKSSSIWIKRQSFGVPYFYWQKGYGAFSIGRTQVDVITQYIANQKEHHRTMTYREEVENFMKRYGMVDYDPDYYWD